VPELLAAGRGIELAGLLPAELQSTSILAAGVFKSSTQADAGQTLIAFLATPQAARAFKAAGFDPF
jgi:molybdate transport system substrate-binding protein